MRVPIAKENSTQRNLFRNLMAQAQNRMFPGNQRNVTSRDSMAFIESTDYSMSTVVVQLGDSPMVGVSVAGE